MEMLGRDILGGRELIWFKMEVNFNSIIAICRRSIAMAYVAPL